MTPLELAALSMKTGGDKIRFANLSSSSKYFRWYFFDRPFDLFGWIKETSYVWDADICGDYTHYWALVDGDRTTFYKVSHNWYVERDPEFEVVNDFEFEEVNRESLTGDAKDNLRFVI